LNILSTLSQGAWTPITLCAGSADPKIRKPADGAIHVRE
jgi:hypothetical protein